MTPALKNSVLIVDDEPQIRRLLKLTLENAGYKVAEAETGEMGIGMAAAGRPDGIVLDLGLPDIDGMTVLRRLRAWSQTPVLILTIRDGEEDMIAALDAGADDYLKKPFSSRELLARFRAVLRRGSPAPETAVITFGDVEVDLSSRIVKKRGEEVKLTGKEYALLQMLVQHRGRVIIHREILRQLWGPHAVDCTHYVRVQMTHLRQKLEAEPQRPRHLLTEAGIGYRLVD